MGLVIFERCKKLQVICSYGGVVLYERCYYRFYDMV